MSTLKLCTEVAGTGSRLVTTNDSMPQSLGTSAVPKLPEANWKPPPPNGRLVAVNSTFRVKRPVL